MRVGSLALPLNASDSNGRSNAVSTRCHAASPLPYLSGIRVKVLVCFSQAHVNDPDTPPLLIFPEGTCVNNEYCVMFKRGAFDLGATVRSIGRDAAHGASILGSCDLRHPVWSGLKSAVICCRSAQSP